MGIQYSVGTPIPQVHVKADFVLPRSSSGEPTKLVKAGTRASQEGVSEAGGGVSARDTILSGAVVVATWFT